MTRLKYLLLAGTILPALTFFPLGTASAQAPDQNEHHGGRPHEGGGARGEGKGGEGGHAQKQGAEHRQGGPPQRDNSQGAPAGGPKAAHGAAADESPRGEGKRRGQGAERAQGSDNGKPGPGGASRTDESRQGRKGADEGPKAKEANEPNRAAPDNRAAQSREEGKDRRDMSRDRGDSGPKGGARDNAERDNNGPRGGDRMRAGDRDNNRAGGNRDRAEDRRDNERPGDDRVGARPDDRRVGDRDERRPGPGGPGPGPAVVVSPGFGGGFMPPTQARRLDDLRRDRHEVREGDKVFIREPGRTIVQEGGRAFIVHDENDRYRALGLNVRRERRGADFVDVVARPNGDEILTFTDPSGRMLRRVRRTRDGREFVLIDNGVGGRVGVYADDVVVLPPPPLRIPRDRYVVDYRDANPNLIYDTLIAPPLASPPRRYTLDQIRYSPDVRNYVRSVDINTINFDSGSWDVPAVATGKLEGLGTAINRTLDRNPNAVFLIEGYTDATGNPNDNLSLSDRRAQSVAEILTKDFKVPPENLTTQGYGQQNLKENTPGPSEVNRRVVVQNITQLLAAGSDVPAPGH